MQIKFAIIVFASPSVNAASCVPALATPEQIIHIRTEVLRMFYDNDSDTIWQRAKNNKKKSKCKKGEEKKGQEQGQGKLQKQQQH